MRQPVRIGRAASITGVLVVGLAVALLSAPVATADGGTLPPPPAPAVLSPVAVAGSTAAAPTASGVAAAVTPLIGKSLGKASVVVIDPSTSTVLLDDQAGTAQDPRIDPETGHVGNRPQRARPADADPDGRVPQGRDALPRGWR